MCTGLILSEFSKLVENEYGIKIAFMTLRKQLPTEYIVFIIYEIDPECIPGPPPILKRATYNDYKNRNKQTEHAPLGRINPYKSYFRKKIKWQDMKIDLRGQNMAYVI